MERNALVVHGGGPTAVLNASLYGVLTEAERSGQVDKVYGAIGGSEAILKERLLDLLAFPEEVKKRLLQTPASAIGSSRYALTDADYRAMIPVLQKYQIAYVLFNGGNGTMDTCGRLYEACKGTGICVTGIPKTIDNDIAITDHTPGYASAARYMAVTTAEIGADVKALPIHVCIIEAMGRNAGWIAAASALARKKPGDAPHLIYLPERPFCEEEFLEDVKRLHEEKGGVVVVVSEGLKNRKGDPVVPPIFKTDRATYYGDVSAHLANLVVQRLGIKARSEKPGLSGRSSVALMSPVDREEAVLAGSHALRAAIEGQSGVMAGIMRKELPDGGTGFEITMIPISSVMMHERIMPDSYINERGNDVTEHFIDWCRPLIGPPLLEFADYRAAYERGEYI